MRKNETSFKFINYLNKITKITGKKYLLISSFLGVFLLLAPIVSANGGSSEMGGHDFTTTFLWLAIILVSAKISSLVEKFGQPAVLGELIMGVILGNLVLLGIYAFEPLKTDSVIAFLAELGVVILFRFNSKFRCLKTSDYGIL